MYLPVKYFFLEYEKGSKEEGVKERKGGTREAVEWVLHVSSSLFSCIYGQSNLHFTSGTYLIPVVSA